MPPNKKTIVVSRPHEQYNLPSFLDVKAKTALTNSDFELKGPNILKTAKDLNIKNVFGADDKESFFLHGQRFKRTEVRGAVTTISMSDYLIAVTALAVAPTIGLPHPSIAGTGKTFVVKDEAGGALTTTITVVSEGERTIDGAASSTLITNYQCKEFYTDGANWFTR